MDAVHAGKIKRHVRDGRKSCAVGSRRAITRRQALAELECLVVQDIFITETAYFADVILPASAFPEKTGTFTNTDRMVQLGRRALDMPGEARQDLWIIQELARRLGCQWSYSGPESGVRAVFDEMRKAMDSIAGITWERLENESSVTYPCEKEGDPGESVVFIDRFPARIGPRPLRSGRHHSRRQNAPTSEYPFVLITGRQLEHWHTGSMTRRSGVLDAIEPYPVASLMHPLDLDEFGAKPGDIITVASRRGSISLYARDRRRHALGCAVHSFLLLRSGSERC